MESTLQLTECKLVASEHIQARFFHTFLLFIKILPSLKFLHLFLPQNLFDFIVVNLESNYLAIRGIHKVGDVQSFHDFDDNLKLVGSLLKHELTH